MFRVVTHPGREVVGSIGYRERTWRGETVYETGWDILPEFGGRGLATAAGVAVIARARAETATSPTPRSATVPKD
jgi:RimJ/RimL family protein N-acetyltransferase